MMSEIGNWLLGGMPIGVRRRMDDAVDALHVAREVQNPWVLTQMIPSVARGLLVKKGKQHEPVRMPARHSAYFDFEYRGEFPEMYDLYRRAVRQQWDAETQLDWSIDVDPLNPEVPILAKDFVPFETLEEHGVRLDEKEKRRFVYSFASWILSQFLHGEQGALYAAAQVTESVQWLDGKFYGSTQVMDEGRHVEVFFRYLETKLGKLYQVNDNLYVILDQLMTDSRWDMKFLGMQIMIEGLALGAFGLIHGSTGEPLLKELLRYVIQDEARHVHYGVLALRRHFDQELSEAERSEREDWCYEIALLMRNRFLAHEVFEEWFEGKFKRSEWDETIQQVPYMQKFRAMMFKRLIPNLEYIGLLTPRVQHLYEKAGLMTFAGGKSAAELSAEDLLEIG